MKVGVMQPYFLPYIGYFQLINYVDRFVVYDNIEYTKKGWINRNRILMNGKDEYISLPLKNDSDYLNVSERFLSDSFDSDRTKLLRKIESAYRKAPQYSSVMTLLTVIFTYDNKNLFDFIFHSLRLVCDYLGIETEMVVSSSIDADHKLKSEKKVISICKRMGASVYVNPIGGLELYSKENFKSAGMDLQFIKSAEVKYPQFDHDFVPWLSIIDVMMFNSVEEIQLILKEKYTIEN